MDFADINDDGKAAIVGHNAADGILRLHGTGPAMFGGNSPAGR